MEDGQGLDTQTFTNIQQEILFKYDDEPKEEALLAKRAADDPRQDLHAPIALAAGPRARDSDVIEPVERSVEGAEHGQRPADDADTATQLDESQQIKNTGELQAQTTTTVERRRTHKMATDANLTYTPGSNDTQPFHSQFVSNYVNQSRDHTAHPNVNHVDADARAYETGDTGHIDIVGDQDTYVGQEEDPGTEDEAGQESEENTQIREGIVTSPPPFSPTTPAFAGYKRDRRGNLLSSALRTPAPDLSAMFQKAPQNPVMGLSQVFRETQAVSSPPPGVSPRAEFFFDRPSPEFKPFLHSSPGPEDSPAMARRGPLQRAHTEPHGVYVPLKDSQERRKRQQQDMTRAVDEMSEDELSQDSEARRAELRRMRLAIAEKTASVLSFGDLRYSKRDSRRGGKSSSSASANLKTPANRKGRSGHPIPIPDDTPQPRPQEHKKPSEVDESDADCETEFVELSQSIISGPRSSARKRRDDYEEVERPDSSPREVQAYDDDGDAQLSNSNHRRSFSRSSNAENHTPSSQVVQVAYSQNGNINPSDIRLQHPPRPVLASSIDSRTFISQSQQDYSLSSYKKTQNMSVPVTISSSVPRAAPVAFNDDDDEEDEAASRLSSPPSSPPVQLAKRNNVEDTHQAGSHSGVVEDAIHSTPPLEPGKNNEHARDRSSRNVPDASVQLKGRKPLRTIPDTSPGSSQAEHVDEQNHIEMNSSTERSEMFSPSNGTAAFNTALTHQSSAANQYAFQRHMTDENREVPTFRNLRSIGIDPTPPDVNMNIDASLDILNQDHDLFPGLLNESHTERRQLTRPMKQYQKKRRILQEPSLEENRLPEPVLNDGKLQDLRMAPFIGTPQTSDIQRPPVSPITAQSSQVNLVAGPIISNAEISANGLDNLQRQTRQNNATVDNEPLQSITSALVIDTSLVQNPNRVLAKFKDARRMAYWPATCLGVTPSGEHLKVQFDDGNVDNEMLKIHVRSFELREGDVVKVDIDEYRKLIYTVVEVKRGRPAPRNTAEALDRTDRFGNRSVVLKPKQQEREAEANSLEVPMSKIYITNNLLSQFSDRPYTHIGNVSSTRVETPTTGLSAPTTPTSRSRRRTVTASTHPAVSFLAMTTESKSTLFVNMGFAVSFAVKGDGSKSSRVNLGDDKSAITRLIRQHGGYVLPDGFETLFEHASTILDPNEIPTSFAAGETPFELQLSPGSKDLEFVALITDSHSRREKYVQALALDIPCLSRRWIRDSISRGSLLPWDRYLLPAGESVVLHGAIRSRTFPEYSFNTPGARLEQVVSRRAKLLHDSHVLLVVGNGKEEKRKTYVFLTLALGAKRVERVKSVEEARKRLNEPQSLWNLVYVDDGNIDAASAALVSQAAKGAKRKRRSGGDAAQPSSSLSHSITISGKAVRVVGDEFVVQSLILGALIDE